MYKTIKLTKGAEAIVDAEDFDWLNQWKWTMCKGYAVRMTSRKQPPRRFIHMHRLILGIDGQKLPLSDHVNGNTIDNRRNNLRKATFGENCQNTKRHGRNSSGYRGVSKSKTDGKWCAFIQADKKHVYLGTFDSAEIAYSEYLKAATDLHGQFRSERI